MESHRALTNQYRGKTINAIIGNQSYVAQYGHQPGPEISEIKRIRTHLTYVRNLLANKDISNLSENQKERRNRNLRRLTAYISEESFPVNEGYPNQRRPNFIDSEGRVCAVGYLIAQSQGLEAAKRIKKKYQYAYVRDMQSAFLAEWADRNGFTIRELAMIQPAYDWEDPHQNDKINRSAEVLWLGANVGLSGLNTIQGFRNSSSLVPAIGGIASGVAQFTLGTSEFANYSTTDKMVGGVTLLAGSWGIYKLLNPVEKSKDSRLSVSMVPNNKYKKNIGLYVNVDF